jgi:hypothetical protein
LILAVSHSGKINEFLKPFLIASLSMLTRWSDWSLTAPVWVIVFDMFRKSGFKRQAAAFAVASVIMVPMVTVYLRGGDMSGNYYRFAVLLAIIPLAFYNGERTKRELGKTAAVFNKWAFYIFYPAHMLVLLFIRYGFKIFEPALFY